MKKKYIHLIRQKKFNIGIELIYHGIIKKIILFSYFFNKIKLVFKKISFNSYYKYDIKLISFVSKMSTNQLSNLKERFVYLNNLKTQLVLPQSKHILTVLRSPFVYKKSREQFFYNTCKLKFKTSLLSYNFFLQQYNRFFFKNYLKKNSIFKFTYKLVILKK